MPDLLRDGVAWIGLDIGTQSCRALAVDDHGITIARAARPLRGHRDGNRHEQNPQDWWTAAIQVLTAVTGVTGARPVGGIAMCATSGTVLLTDSAGTPLTPGLMYDDARAGTLAGEAQTAGADLWQKLGYRIQPAWALPKLLWWRDHDLLIPDARVAHQPDVVAAALTGHPVASDSSHALKTGYDQLDRCWPPEVLDRLRLDPATLPPVVPPGTTLGVVCADAAERTGLPVGTPVVAGMTDGCAAQLGAGALAPGEWNSVLGTTLALKGVGTALLHDPTGAVYSHRAPYGDLWLPGGASSTGAGAVRTLFPDADLDALTRTAAGISDVPLCYPLTGHGERFPFVAPQARGFLGDDGLDRPGSDTARVFAAVCTGVAHVERLCFDVLRGAGADVAGPVSFTGGGSRNPWWNQLRCDLLGVPVRLPEDPEPARGMAVLAAGAADGDIPAAARRLVRVRGTLEPDPDRAAALAPGYDTFVTALADRAWLDPGVATQARSRNRNRFAAR